MGFLKIVLGSMYSGKTTFLLNIYNKYTYNDLKCCVINYSGDNRYHDTMMSTHTKQMISCVNCYMLHDTLKSVDSNNQIDINEYDIFLINEGQFFSDLKEFVKKLVDEHDKIVYVCGLDGDFRRNKFGDILDLIPLCDEVVKLKGVCKICKKDSIFTHRLSSEKEQTIIGNDNYISLCRSCYMEKVF